MADKPSTHRDLCIGASQKAQEDYDKAILSLAGGALGISFIFLKDFLQGDPPDAPRVLFAAWVAWALAIGCIVISFATSQRGWRLTIAAIDDQTYATEKPNIDRVDRRTQRLNNSAGFLLFVGVVLFASFVYINLGHKHAGEETRGLQVWIDGGSKK